ncbi:phosphopantetheine-binding protein [Corynebacterium sp. Q4381]|uniref:acyl carrier protein n=1 Tax=Corynebacterium sp. Marseille-Q4381 TaxID=3121597 RepID=UPI002FE53299
MLSELLALLSTRFDATPEPETALADSGLTSLDLIELAVRIEDEFGVRISEDVYQQHATVGELAAYIEEHQP